MIVNRQRSVPISIRSLERFTVRASRLLELPADCFTICLVTSGAMARWNRAYRGKDRPTDVLSFPSGENGVPQSSKQNRADGSNTAYLGDIAIAPAVARGNALCLGRTLQDEMRILILHGILHLMGYDHETDSGQMERRERRLRRALGLG